MERASPSPVATQTSRSGRMALMPVATAGGRPWVVVETKSVHVVGEAAGAADAAHDYEIFALDAEFGEDGLHGGEDGVVAAAGAPADFLIGLEVFLCEYWQRCGGHLLFLFTFPALMLGAFRLRCCTGKSACAT